MQDPSTWSGVSHTVVPAWYDRPGYVRAMGQLIRSELSSFTEAEKAEGGLHVLFSAHGVPKSYIQVGRQAGGRHGGGGRS